MSLISPSQAQDGVTGVNAASINNPINTIANDYNGNITDANISSSAAIAGSKLAGNGVTADKLATNAITIGYTQITTPVTTTSTTQVQATGVTSTVVIPAGSRRIKVTVYCSGVSNSSAANGSFLGIWDGTVGSGTQLQQYNLIPATNAGITMIWSGTPAAGSKTYNVGYASITSGTTTFGASATAPGFILVEVI